MQPSFQNTPPFGVSNIPVMGGVSGAFGIVDPFRSSGFRDPFRNIVDPFRSSGFRDPFRNINVQSSGKVTFHLFFSLLLGSLARARSCQNFFFL